MLGDCVGMKGGCDGRPFFIRLKAKHKINLFIAILKSNSRRYRHPLLFLLKFGKKQDKSATFDCFLHRIDV